ncbi:MAG: methanogenesis marker protein Mmp4/MtxX [archaeon]|nr:methanogenesis marker protein Mmp4/MtxX [archaeon]
MFTSRILLERHVPNGVKVGIGCSGMSSKAKNSVKGIDDYATVYTDPVRLIDDLVTDKINAAVRGDMSSSVLLPILKKKMGVSELERIVLFEFINGKFIVTAPVGIDEGWTIEQKYSLAVKSVKFMKKIGMNTRIAVMSGGRKDDMGRHPVVDRTICDALKLVNMLNNDGYDAYDAEILIEEAVDNADLIIAPDGISGNLIFRTMHFIGGVQALGAPIVNIDKVFIDTSRAKNSYKDSIALAMRLAEGKL